MQLPAGAQTWLSVGNDAAWTDEAHIAASVFDALNIANWQRSGDKNAKRPVPFPRPAAAREASEQVDRMELRARAFLERQRRAQAQQRPPQSRPRDARGRFVKEA